MPHTYLPGTYIPELNGKAEGAVSVVCHSPLDLECVLAVAELAPRPPGSPLASIASALSQPNSWDAWRDHWRSQGGYMPNPDSPLPGSLQKTLDDDLPEAVESDAENLRLVLAGLHHIWLAQEADTPHFSCVVSIAFDQDGAGARLEWTGTQPALAFGGGSLWASVGKAAWKARAFLAGLVLGGGIDAASRSAGLVERARRTARERQRRRVPVPKDLPRLDVPLAPGVVPAGGSLCILVHGLCSTDVGTFDTFEERIRERSGKAGNAVLTVVGFPHDSLTTDIHTNGRELARLIISAGVRNCRLVCHSRGGLVARWAAHWLKREAPAAPPQPWIHSCVTFGTPHLGTSAASAPSGLTAAMLSLAHLGRTPGAQAVADVLCGVKDSTFVGVSELRPAGIGGSGLGDLQRAEDCLFVDDALPLQATGSSGPLPNRSRSVTARLMERVMGTAEHDLLVPIGSSAPSLRVPARAQRTLGRTHFEYFSRLPEDGAGDPSFWEAPLQALGLPNK
jgi:hypothetical protein